MKYLSICSGIEAASVAWEPLGWKPVGFSEIEKFPSAVLAHHWPDVPNLGDMTKHHDWPTTLQPDLIVGGTPCQAFSVAGLRQGLADPRGNLTLTFLSILEQYRPRWVVWENVPGVLSDKTGAFGAFLGGLGELGYGFAYRVLDAQYFGVPQRRRRVFVVGCLGDWQRAAAVLFESHSLQGHTPPRREAGQTIAGTLKSCAKSGGWSNSADHAAAGYMIPVATGFETGPCGGSIIDTAPTLDTRCKDGPIRNQLGAGVLCMSTGQAGAEIGIGIGTTLNCNHEAPIVCTQYGDIAGSLTARHDSSPCADQTSHILAFDTTQITSKANYSNPKPIDPCHPLAAGAHAPAIVGTYCIAENIIGRQDHNGGNGAGHQEELAYTLNTVAPPAVAFGVSESPDIAHCLRSGASKADKHESTTYIASNHIVRRLTPTECARLQGFPDNHCNIPWNGWRAMDTDETPEQCIADGLEVRQNKKTGKWRVKDVDGPKYKALGNSMAVPCMEWLGKRIQMMENS